MRNEAQQILLFDTRKDMAKEIRSVAKRVTNNAPVEMLFQCTKMIMNLTHVSFRDACLQLRDFQCYIQFAGTMCESLPKWSEDLTKRIMQIYKPELMLQDIDDWWGKMIDYGQMKGYSFLNLKGGQVFTPIAIVDFINECVGQDIESTTEVPDGKDVSQMCNDYAKMVAKSDNVKQVLDPCCGSGRFIIRFFKKAVQSVKPYAFFNAEIDIELYRLALMQMFFYRIPGMCLCCDSLVVDLANWENWTKFGNLWNPPHWHEMYSDGGKLVKELL